MLQACTLTALPACPPNPPAPWPACCIFTVAPAGLQQVSEVGEEEAKDKAGASRQAGGAQQQRRRWCQRRRRRRHHGWVPAQQSCSCCCCALRRCCSRACRSSHNQTRLPAVPGPCIAHTAASTLQHLHACTPPLMACRRGHQGCGDQVCERLSAEPAVQAAEHQQRDLQVGSPELCTRLLVRLSTVPGGAHATAAALPPARGRIGVALLRLVTLPRPHFLPPDATGMPPKRRLRAYCSRAP